MKLKRWWDSGLLVIIALILATAIRLNGLEGTYVRAFDPFFFWRVSQSIWDTGSWEMNDTLRYFPYGWDSNDVAPALPHSMVLLGRVAGDLKAGVRWFPYFFGALSILAMAMLGRKFGVSGLAALVLAVIPAYIYRTSEGFADKEPLALFLGLLGWYFMVNALENKSWTDAVYAGLSFGFIVGVWGGKILFVLSLVPLAAVLALKEKHESLFYIGISMAVYQLLHFSVPRYRHFLADPFSLIVIGLASFFILLHLVYINPRWEKFGRNRLWACVGAGVVLLMLLSFVKFNDPLYVIQRGADTAMRAFKSSSAIHHYQTVQENARPTWSWSLKSNSFWQQMGMFFFLAVPAVYFLVNGKDDKEMLLGSLAASGIYAGFAAIRLFVFTALGVSLASAYIISKFLENKEVMVKVSGLLLIGLSFYLIYPGTMGSMNTAKYASLTGTWYENLKWMEFNVPPEDPIVTWWDYGYWIQTIGNRTSLGDGANMAPGYRLNWRTGHFFATGNYTNATDWFNSWNLKYVTVDYAMLPKYFAYSTLGGISNSLNILKYYKKMMTEFGMADVYVGYSDDYRAGVAVAPITIEDKIYIMLGVIQNGAISWKGVVDEYAILSGGGRLSCEPIGYCKSEKWGNYGLVNQSAFIYWGQQIILGDQDSMHSTFARLWFFDGYGTQFKEVLNNGECKTFMSVV